MPDEPRGNDVLMLSDCPIQPHVWREFRDRGSQTLELIAHVRPESSSAELAAVLREWLPATGEDDRNSIFTFDVYVLVEVDFKGVVTALLPLTGWSDLLQRIAQLPEPELLAELDAAKSPMAPRLPTTASNSLARLSHEDYGRLRWLLAQVVAVRHDISAQEMGEWINIAVARAPREAGPILSVGYNRWAEPNVSATRRTIKADAAQEVFSVDCSSLTWAIVDTGIDATHPMFAVSSPPAPANGPQPALAPKSRICAAYDIPAGIATLRQRAANQLYANIATDADWQAFADAALVNDAPQPDPGPDRFAVAANDHGTHVAGILAGGTHLRSDLQDFWKANIRGDEPESLLGICPTLRLIDIRVFDHAGRSREFEVVIGLAFLRWLNRQRDSRIDGVNISLSIPFAVDNFACGWTPVCVECDRLVSAGIVVVVSAGNSGFDDSRGTTSIGSGFQMISIADPGNAETVITVGATHRTDPHRYGPISRSARGPTADGRHKPDLLAPGDAVWGPVPHGGWGRKSGTSQAAPHVSGVAAMLLARYPELRGRPDRVKEILCETATDLRRLVDFQGHGLVDALRALQRP